MIETHPFGYFVPKDAKYLLLGSFTTKEAYDDKKKGSYTWFYSSGRNQFWPILELVYGIKLRTRKEMEGLFLKLKMALGDIIYQCERRKNSNLDINLSNMVYAIDDVTQIVERNSVNKIFFSSRFVETKFKRHFKNLIKQHPAIELVTLPSPSPRYATMSKLEKAAKYRELLPRLNQ